MAQETQAMVLDPEVAHKGAAAALAYPDKGRYYVVEAEGQVVAQTLITTEWSDWRNGRFWWIQSVYVLPEWRGRGIFRLLYEYLQSRARACGDVRGLRLYVHRGNEDARAVYERVGMTESEYVMYETAF